MIRFSCRKCGKSLRADDSIVGRSTLCTACKAVNRVPQESTRKSGEKSVRSVPEPVAIPHQADLFDEEIVTLIADSDSFEGFEDLDLSKIKIETEESNGNKSPVPTTLVAAKNAAGTHKDGTLQSAPSDPAPAVPVKDAGQTWRQTPRSLSPLPFIFLGLLAVFMVGGYFGYRLVFSEPPEVRKTELELSSIGYQFEKTLKDLKRTQRFLDQYIRMLSDKNIPESNLTSAKDLNQRFRSVVADGTTQLAAANKLYDAKNQDGAKQLLSDHIELMTELQKEMDQENRQLDAVLKSGQAAK